MRIAKQPKLIGLNNRKGETKMKKDYMELDLTIYQFSLDVVRTSNPNGGGSENETEPLPFSNNNFYSND